MRTLIDRLIVLVKEALNSEHGVLHGLFVDLLSVNDVTIHQAEKTAILLQDNAEVLIGEELVHEHQVGLVLDRVVVGLHDNLHDLLAGFHHAGKLARINKFLEKGLEESRGG